MKKDMQPELYSAEEIETLEAYIEAAYGHFETVCHEIGSPDIHVDIYVVEPSPERNYYTLVTLGMGAHRMKVPEALEDAKVDRAELSISLPADWNIHSPDERWYWPLRWLKIIARLPGEEDSWIGWGHTVGNPDPGPIAGTGFTGFMLLSPLTPAADKNGDCFCVLPDGSEVNFYDIVPLYPEELDFKLRWRDAAALLELMDADPEPVRLLPVDLTRKNVCTTENLNRNWARTCIAALEAEERDSAETVPEPDDGGTPSNGMLDGEIMDDGAWHLSTLREKALPLDELSAYAHMALYLRWCAEHNLMNEAFLDRHGAALNDALHGNGDLRALLRDALDGVLLPSYFTSEGAAFAAYYYSAHAAETGFCYPADVDECALRYWGEDRYNSPEFQDEAYLFVPYDEGQYERIRACIDRRWAAFQEKQAALNAPLLGEEELAALEHLCDGVDGYFGKMLQYLENFVSQGVASGRFTEAQAHADLGIALWYAYACINCDQYETYYMASQWMPAAEKNAAGCGVWYYRYACALMFCSKLDDALHYAREGTVQEPDYPWNYLLLGKLYAHFGDKAAALNAVTTGLRLKPEDYEFTTLRREIEMGRNLEEMNYHVIDPTGDWQLQNGLLPELRDKQLSVACILCNEKRLAQIKELFAVSDWDTSGPYCAFTLSLNGQKLDGLFRMNEAALSKMDPERLASIRAHLAKHCLCRRTGGFTFQLTAMAVNRDYGVDLQYQETSSGHTITLRHRDTDDSARTLPVPSVLDATLLSALQSAMEGDGD